MPPTLSYDNPEAYIAGDRRRALAAGRSLPDRVHGAALFADISGFTPLTEALVAELGAQRGAEQLSVVLDELFDELLGHLHRHDGSVVYFSGDAVTCWLDGDDGLLATSCALAMQAAMSSVGLIELPSGRSVRLAMKVAVAVGPARRFVVGDHLVQLIDVLAGALMDQLADTEHHAGAGEVLLHPSAAERVGDRVLGDRVLGERVRRDRGTGDLGAGDRGTGDLGTGDLGTGDLGAGDLQAAPGTAYLRATALRGAAALPGPPAGHGPLPEAVVRQWLLPAVYERLRTGRGEFLAELRTAVPLFLRFGGIDFDDDPDAAATLDAFVVDAQRIVDGYGGSVLQLTIGDKGAYLYAVFGTPLAHEDDPARACAAALELRDLAATHPVTDLQIGLARGRLRSGTYGHATRRTFCCLGDAVNLAARLMAAAPPGQVYVAGPVHDTAGPGYRWDRLPDQQLKGKTAAVAAYALVGVERRGGTRHRRHTLPMIGRVPELAQVERHVVEAGDGRGQVVALVAPSGLGKSRLLVEAARVLAERGVPTYEGEAQAFGTHSSYGLWHGIWTAALGVPDDVPVPVRQRHVADRVAAVAPHLLPRVPLLSAALDLPLPDNDLTAGLGAKLRKASLEALLVELVTALTAAGGPVAFLLEDTQWLDPLSLDLLHELGRAVVDLPVLVLLAHRSGSGDVLGPLRGLAHVHEIELPELDETDCRAIIAAKLGQLGELPGTPPEPLVATVLERAEGNPFYLEELLTFIHGQGVDPTDAAALAALALPDSLHSLVLSRIDTLAEGPRRTVKVASVIGRSFRVPVLRGVYPELGTTVEIDQHLAELRRIDLVVVDRAGSATQDPTLLFRHVITAQAAYEATPVALREVLHEKVAYYVERVDGSATGGQLDLLAYHYGRSANLGKKREYLLRAGDRARTDYANAAAIDYYRRVADLVAEGERTPVLLRLGGVLELTGAWGEAETVYAAALELAERLDDRLAGCRVRKALAEVARKQGRYDEAGALLAAAQQGFERLGDRAGVGEVLHLVGTLHAQQGQLDEARTTYEASLEIRRALDDRPAMAALFSNLGVIAEYAGELDRAQELNERALALRLEVGERWAIGVSQNNLGMIALLQHDYSGAVRRFGEAMRLNEEVGDRWMVAIAHNNLGNAMREQGDLDAAAVHLGQALAGYRRQDDRWALAIVFEDVATLAVARGEGESALTLVGAADTLRSELGSPRAPAQAEALDRALADVRRELGARSDDLLAVGRGLVGDAATAAAELACR